MKKIDVFIANKKVGTIALTKDKVIAFQYDDEWLKNGFSINPIKLPLSSKVFVSTTSHFRGLFGVFADSLPDSYGELLLDRYLRAKGIDTNTLPILERLSYIGSSGMGSLEYIPDNSAKSLDEEIDFDQIQKECDALFSSKKVNEIDSLYMLGGSSGGARPKALINYKNEERIVKFSSRFDPKNIAELEYNCMFLAKSAGINIPEIELFISKKGNKYFLIKRFDREKNKKIHMISVAGILECDFRAPSLDYNDLIKLTRVLTRNDEDVLEIYRRMVFNVLIDNQDDHAKNFAFIYNEKERMYRLSPAFDITPSKTYFGEHTTSINGKGKDITDDDMLKVAIINRINKQKAESIIKEIRSLLVKEGKNIKNS